MVMRSSCALAVLSLALSACEPPMDPADPTSEEDLPCQSDRDCELHGTDSAARRAFCASMSVGVGSASAKDAAACGPIPSMSMNATEPELLCFRGTCVPVGSRR
jgi:hypothetical protein